MEFVRTQSSMNVPKNVGVKGLLRILEALLTEIPHVVRVSLTATGTIEYEWYAPKDSLKDDPLTLPATILDDLTPYQILRKVQIHELPGFGVTTLLHACHKDKLYPIGFVTGVRTTLWKWLSTRLGVDFEATNRYDDLFGYPVLSDSDIPDDTLILCAGYGRTIHIADTFAAYKIVMEGPNAQ